MLLALFAGGQWQCCLYQLYGCCFKLILFYIKIMSQNLTSFEVLVHFKLIIHWTWKILTTFDVEGNQAHSHPPILTLTTCVWKPTFRIWNTQWEGVDNEIEPLNSWEDIYIYGEQANEPKSRSETKGALARASDQYPRRQMLGNFCHGDIRNQSLKGKWD